MKTGREEHMQELLDKADDQIIEQAKEIKELKQEIERINTAFKRKIQNLETRYNAMIHKRDRKIDKLQIESAHTRRNSAGGFNQ